MKAAIWHVTSHECVAGHSVSCQSNIVALNWVTCYTLMRWNEDSRRPFRKFQVSERIDYQTPEVKGGETFWSQFLIGRLTWSCHSGPPIHIYILTVLINRSWLLSRWLPDFVHWLVQPAQYQSWLSCSPQIMDVFKSLIQPIVGGGGGSSVIDGMKLVVLGGTVETARRVSSSAWSVSSLLRNIPFWPAYLGLIL